MLTKHKTLIALVACLLFTHNAYSMHKYKFDLKPLLYASITKPVILIATVIPIAVGSILLLNAITDDETPETIQEKRIQYVLNNIRFNFQLTPEQAKKNAEQLYPDNHHPTPLKNRIFKGIAGITIATVGTAGTLRFLEFVDHKFFSGGLSKPLTLKK